MKLPQPSLRPSPLLRLTRQISGSFTRAVPGAGIDRHVVVAFSGWRLVREVFHLVIGALLLLISVYSFTLWLSSPKRSYLGVLGFLVLFLLGLGEVVVSTINLKDFVKLWWCGRKLLKSGDFGGLLCRPGHIRFRRTIDSKGGGSEFTKFEPSGDPRLGPPEPGPYYFNHYTGGFVYGCRVEEGPCRGLLLAVFDPSKACSLQGEISASSKEGDWARGVVEPAGPGLVRARLECNLVRARGARLVIHELRPYEVELVSCRESGVVEAVVDLRGFEKPLFVVGPGEISIDSIKEFTKAKIAGLCASIYMRLVLDIPHAVDVEAIKRVSPVNVPQPT